MTAYRPRIRHGLALAALLAASAAGAAETVVALSPEAKAKILNDAAAKPSTSLGESAVNAPDRQVHGEVGMMIGTNGARGVFGSAVAPLGGSGSVAVAVENSRFGRLR